MNTESYFLHYLSNMQDTKIAKARRSLQVSFTLFSCNKGLLLQLLPQIRDFLKQLG